MFKSAQKGNTLLTLIIVVVLSGLFILYFNKTPSSPSISLKTATPASSPNTETKTYRSKNLKFSIKTPNYFAINEGYTYVNLLRNNEIVEIVRNGTNFDSLKTYLENSDSRKQLSILKEEEKKIDNYESFSRIEMINNTKIQQKIYYILVNNAVYILSTSSESLYNDLDQIAQSFKYTP